MHLARRAYRLREFAAAGVHRAVGRSRRAIGTFRSAGLAHFVRALQSLAAAGSTIEIYDAKKMEDL
jgi:hypothetical protein